MNDLEKKDSSFLEELKNENKKSVEITNINELYKMQEFLSQDKDLSILSSAIDLKNGKMVMIKHIKNILENIDKGEKVLREINVSRKLGHHPNIKEFLSLIVDANKNMAAFIVYKDLESDLNSIINNKKLSIKEIKSIIIQLLEAIRFVHNNEIIHRDIIPSNILINDNFELHVTNFSHCKEIGKSEISNKSNNKPNTPDVTSLMYRLLITLSKSVYLIYKISKSINIFVNKVLQKCY